MSTIPLKRIANIIAGQSPASGDVEPYAGGQPFLQGNAEFGALVPEPRLQCLVAPKVAHPGDVLLSVRAPVGAVNVADQRYGIGRGLCAVRADSPVREYLWWYLQSQTAALRSVATGSTFEAVSAADVGSLTVPELAAKQMAAITGFLNRETAKIDALIDKQEQLIAALREERQSVVSVALSGCQTIPLHRLVDPARPMSYGILQCGEHIEDGIPYIGPSDMPGRGKSPSLENLRRTSPEIADQYRRSIVQGGDLVVSIGPAYGKVALLEDDLSGSNLTQDTVRVAPVRSSVDPEYLVWALDSYEAESFWDAEITGATFRRLNLGTLGQTPIPLPDLETQRDIRDRLDETTAKVDTLIDKSTEMIETLREYRSALITNAVTGKIDVREAV